MKPTIRNRLHQATSRHEEIGLLLSQPEVFSDQNRFRELSREFAQLGPVVQSWQKWQDSISFWALTWPAFLCGKALSARNCFRR